MSLNIGAGTLTLSTPHGCTPVLPRFGSSIVDDLKVVDVDVHRMRIVVEVGDLPLLHGVEPRLDQRDVREGVVVEHVDDGLGVVVAGLVAADLSVIVSARLTAGVITDVSTNDVYASRFWPGSKAVVCPSPLVSGVARIRVWVGNTKNPSA